MYCLIKAKFQEAKHIYTWLRYDNIIYHLRLLRSRENNVIKDPQGSSFQIKENSSSSPCKDACILSTKDDCSGFVASLYDNMASLYNEGSMPSEVLSNKDPSGQFLSIEDSTPVRTKIIRVIVHQQFCHLKSYLRRNKRVNITRAVDQTKDLHLQR